MFDLFIITNIVYYLVLIYFIRSKKAIYHIKYCDIYIFYAMNIYFIVILCVYYSKYIHS